MTTVMTILASVIVILFNIATTVLLFRRLGTGTVAMTLTCIITIVRNMVLPYKPQGVELRTPSKNHLREPREPNNTP